MGADLLAEAAWACGCTAPGSVQHPDHLKAAAIEWIPATVPGTAAGALRDAERWSWGHDDETVLDGRDWWFRCRFPARAADGAWELQLGGLATVADVWLNGAHLLHSENMFACRRVAVTRLEDRNELAIRCAALAPLLAHRHPRPRWKSRLVRSQSLRWYRTTLLGRMPGWSAWAAPVGPWRAVTLRARRAAGTIAEAKIDAVPHRDGGVIRARIVLERPAEPPAEGWLHAAGESSRLTLERGADHVVAEATVELGRVERWWPHTHGPQPLYEVELELDGDRVPVRNVGFRTVELDGAGGGAGVVVNGVRVFARGAVWVPPDPITLAAAPDEVHSSVALAAAAGMNMLRVAGYGVYEGEPFWDACDRLGVMVWQDCMLASFDPPEDDSFVAAIADEVRQTFVALSGRPALAVACGSSETYQQAAMYGLPRGRWRSELLERIVPEAIASVAGEVPYVPSSPFGGGRPFAPDTAVSHYFGVGAYLRPLADARLAGVRFASECLAFATPPERETVEEVFGDATVAGHAPRWKQAVARDAGASWDFEDVASHYVRELLGVDPFEVRYSDPERALDLVRAVIAELIGAVVGDWRRPSSRCDGALVLSWRDLWPGAGWGVIDALGRPKASFFALRRAFAPTTVTIVDDGLCGLRLNAYNDGPNRFHGRLRLRVLSAAGTELDGAERELELPPRSHAELEADSLLGGFRDLNDAYRFTAPMHDVVAAELYDGRGQQIAQACHLAGGPARPRLPELGLTAQAARDHDGDWWLTVSSTLFAQYVSVNVPGWRPEDSWFHVLPGGSVRVALRGGDGAAGPRGSVRALNCATPARVVGPEVG